MLSENISLKKAIFSKSTQYHFKTINFKNFLTSALYVQKNFLCGLYCVELIMKEVKKKRGRGEKGSSHLSFMFYFLLELNLL